MYSMILQLKLLFCVLILLIQRETVLSGDSPFLVSIKLIKFENPDNKLLTGQQCDFFSILGRLCDINLRLCIEDVKDASSNFESCNSEEWKETGIVEPDSDIVVYSAPHYYDDWPNPYRWTEGFLPYKGVQLKVVAEDSGFEDGPNKEIDQFIIKIETLPGTNATLQVVHQRPHSKFGSLQPTTLTIQVNVECLFNNKNEAFNHSTCSPVTTKNPHASPSTTMIPTTTALVCQHGGTPINGTCYCPALFSGNFCEIDPTRNCYDLHRYYGTKDGVYWINLNGSKVQVYCDKGWTVIQRRTEETPQILFNRTWSEYRRGFGNLQNGSFWIGNDYIYRLTNDPSVGPMTLRVDLEDCQPTAASQIYPKFRIGSETTNYTLEISPGSKSTDADDAGDAINAEQFHLSENGQQFMVPNGKQPTGFTQQDCANVFQGGWWYGLCGSATLNGIYHPNCVYKTPPNQPFVDYLGNGILWLTFQNEVKYSMASTALKIIPADALN